MDDESAKAGLCFDSADVALSDRIQVRLCIGYFCMVIGTYSSCSYSNKAISAAETSALRTPSLAINNVAVAMRSKADSNQSCVIP
jgi:hypothetical protein